jgi:MFS family permease
MIQLFQQRDFGDKINATFQYITQNFRSLGMSLLYIVGPITVGAGITSGIMQSNMLRLTDDIAKGQSDNQMAVIQMISQFGSPSFWLTMLFGLLANVAVVLTTYGHMRVYERTHGQAITVPDVWAEVQPVIGRAVVISVLGSILTTVALLFFIIPGVYVAVVLSLSLAVTTFEGTGFGQTLDRCFKLIRDKWWSTFGLIVVIFIIIVIMGMFFALPSALVAFLVGAKILPVASTLWLIIGNVVTLVGRTLINTVLYLAIGFQYTNLVERQEGRGLLSAIDTIGTSVQSRDTNEGDY